FAAFAPIPSHSGIGEFSPLLVPITQLISVPWRLRRKMGQLELFPYFFRPCHEFLSRESQGRHVVLERRIDHQRSLDRWATRLRPVAARPIRDDVRVFHEI